MNLDRQLDEINAQQGSSYFQKHLEREISLARKQDDDEASIRRADPLNSDAIYSRSRPDVSIHPFPGLSRNYFFARVINDRPR